MIYLASQSITRLALLRRAGVDVSVVKTRFDEAQTQKRMLTLTPTQLALSLAEGKARSAVDVPPGALVLGADQVLAVEDEVLHKVTDFASARTQLQQLRNRTHHLHSAAVICRDHKVVWSHCDEASLTMREFSDGFLEHYLNTTPDFLSSVGCYKIEDLGVQLFSEAEGSHFTILGLPLLQVLDFLRQSRELPS